MADSRRIKYINSKGPEKGKNKNNIRKSKKANEAI
jgi:hypothetical protein